MNRIRLAWAALRGRPVMSGVTVNGGVRVSERGAVIVGNNTVRLSDQ